MIFCFDKRGFLLGEEVLKMVIAVVCVVFLIFLLTSIYFSSSDDEKREHAEAVLMKSSQSVENIINSLDEGENMSVNIFNPEGWYLFGFTGEEIPNSCAGNNCICICDKLWDINILNSQIEECSEDGICLIVKELRKFDAIEIEDGLSVISFQKNGGRIFVSKV